MTLTDEIRKELWHVYHWQQTIERTGALTTPEQVVESGVAQIEAAVTKEVQRQVAGEGEVVWERKFSRPPRTTRNDPA